MKSNAHNYSPDGNRTRELFDRAADLPVEEWGSFLDRECPDDLRVRRDVLQLLKADRQAEKDQFLEQTIDDPPPDDPKTLGKYRIDGRLGKEGGQGMTYLAFDSEVKRAVVLKRYHDGSQGGPSEEAQTLARVDCPYVARCYGIERCDGEAFLVAEYISPGRNLDEVQREKPLDFAEIARIVSLVAEGVAAVHDRGLVHRDIKPANVILGDDGIPRLIDFGLAAYLGSNRLQERGGSPPYMAPEQARVESDRIDFRTDVFGLGALLYMLLTGQTPYTGSDRAEILEQARRGDIKQPRQINRAIPPAIESVCLKALAKAPENRYRDAQQFADALARAIKPTLIPKRISVLMPWVLLATLACVIPAMGIWPWGRGPETAPKSSLTGELGPATALKAEITAKHFKDLGDGRRVMPLGTISEESLLKDPPRLKDLLRVHVALTRPAYLYLIALNPDGKDQLCIASAPAAPRLELDFPEKPTDYFGLTDGVGLQAFVVVASDRPLTAYESWKTQIPGGLVWSPVDREGLWEYEDTVSSQLRGKTRGKILRRELVPEGLISLCERLRQSPGVSLVHALAFPVKPEHDIIK
jgi:serine/threonine protein kinase